MQDIMIEYASVEKVDEFWRCGLETAGIQIPRNYRSSYWWNENRERVWVSQAIKRRSKRQASPFEFDFFKLDT